MLIAERTVKGTYSLKASSFKADHSVFCQAFLKPGTYICQMKVFWSTSDDTFVFSTYGPDEVKLKHIEKIPNFVENIYSELIKTDTTHVSQNKIRKY